MNEKSANLRRRSRPPRKLGPGYLRTSVIFTQETKLAIADFTSRASAGGRPVLSRDEIINAAILEYVKGRK